MKLLPEGVTVTEIAPGMDIQTDILDKAGFALKVSPNLKTMPEFLFNPEKMGARFR